MDCPSTLLMISNWQKTFGAHGFKNIQRCNGLYSWRGCL